MTADRKTLMAADGSHASEYLHEELTYKIRGACYEVYNVLGPGFKEDVYHRALTATNQLDIRRRIFDTARISGHQRRYQRSSAFTLLEMMLALVLFAVGTVAVMDLFHRAQAGATDGENVLIAMQLAQRRLEELRNVSYGSLANEAKASITSPSGFTRFSREVTLTTPFTNLQQIVVTVYWTGIGGETNVSLQTYRSGV